MHNSKHSAARTKEVFIELLWWALCLKGREVKIFFKKNQKFSVPREIQLRRNRNSTLGWINC